MRRTVALCVLAISPLLFAEAQSADSLILQAAFRNTSKLYEDFITPNSGIINGSEYREPRSREEQHAYFGENDWAIGDVKYNGQWYRKASLMYNVESDELIVENPVNGQEIQLVKIKIAEFNLLDRRFLQFREQDLAGLPEPGFYEVAHNGPSRVLIRYEKVYEEKIENSALVLYYTPKIRFYIKSGDSFVRVVRKRDVLKVFSDKKSELRAFIRSKNLKISKHNPRAYGAVAAHYDTLTGNQ